MPTTETTVGQVLIDDALPTPMRGKRRVLDADGLRAMMTEIANNYPEEYSSVNTRMHALFADAGYKGGGYSFGLRHLLPAKAYIVARDQLRAQTMQLMADKTLSREERDKKIINLISEAIPKIHKDVMDESVAEKNPLAMQILSGAKGKPVNLSSLRAADLLYTDHRGNTIPMPIFNSYSEGLTPSQYWASSYGGRKGIIDLAKCLFIREKVLMADYSEKEIGQIEPGEMVMGADKSGRIFPVRVVARHDNGLRQCCRYRFRKGSARRDDSMRELIATDDHKVLAQIKAGRPGSTYADRSVYAPVPLPLKEARICKNPLKAQFIAYPARGEYDAERVNEPLALLAGLMLGNGCMAPSMHGRYTFSTADHKLLEQLQAYLSQFNLSLHKFNEFQYYFKEIEHTKRPTAVVNGHNSFVPGHTSRVMGWLKQVVGESKAPGKKMPAEVWSWDDASVGAFLSGLFVTDGCIHARKMGGVTIRLSMTARSLVEDVQRLLELRMGVWSSALVVSEPTTTVSVGRGSSSIMSKHTQYAININHPESIKVFAKRIPLVGIKHERLMSYLPLLSDSPRSAEVGFKVCSREDMGVLPTCDLEVDHPEHLFVLANGLIVSNSTQKAGQLSKEILRSVHRLVVTHDDYDHDPAHPRGLPVDTSDPDNEGSFLAHDAGPYKRNTLLTARTLEHLNRLGLKKILVRSPTVGGPPGSGVASKDVGIRERGVAAPIGDFVGLAGASSLSEPITQATICLRKGTMVRMPDGSGLPIEEIEAGEYVMGFDSRGHTQPVRVIARHDNGVHPIFRSLFRLNGKDLVLESTTEHKVLAVTGGRARTAVHGVPFEDSGVRINSLSLSRVGLECARFLAMTVTQEGLTLSERYRQSYVGEDQTYDLEVAHRDHMFVLLNGIVVSNSSKHCLSEGTLVKMADGSERAVELIKPGDKVLGANSEGDTLGVTVTDVFDNGEQECFSYTFSPNSRDRAYPVSCDLVCTNNHKILADNSDPGGKRAKIESGKLRRYHRAVAVGKRLDTDGWTDEPFALLLGLLLGNGCYVDSIGGCVCFSTMDQKLLDQTEEYMQSLNLRFSKRIGHQCYYGVSCVEDTANQDPITGRMLPGSRNPAKLVLERYGMWGKYAHEKSLPDEVNAWSNGSVSQLLAGLFMTDGSFFLACNKKYLVANYATVSKKMADQVRELLMWRFGIASSITTNDYGGRKRTLYSVLVTRGDSVRRLIDNIPIIGEKRDKIDELRHTLDGRTNNSPFGWKLRSSSPVGCRRTYDLRVDHPDHLFVLANGLIVSNSGGVAGAAKNVSGFKMVDAMINHPEFFVGGAAHAQRDGTITKITPAPGGGSFIHVGDEPHYIGVDSNPSVKIGDEVEAGDALTDGLANPNELTKHKGIGESRRLFTENFTKALRGFGVKAHRRNVELLARGLIDHVRLTEPMGDFAPDDVVNYHLIEHDYQPRDGHQITPPARAYGRYLEKPVLHYSIGTRVTPRVASQLKEYGVDNVVTHQDPPPFQPELTRAVDYLQHDPDWMTRMLGTKLERNLLNSAHRGLTSDEQSTSYVPTLARAVDFGKTPTTAGWKPQDIITGKKQLGGLPT